MFLERFPLVNNRTLLPVNEINVILYSHLLYRESPDELELFWKNYPYFNPNIIDNLEHKYHFLELTRLKTGHTHFKKKLNNYLNVKFNPSNFYQPLQNNLLRFSVLAMESSIILQNILKRADLPPFVESVLAESEKVADTNDILELITIYQEFHDLKTRYEILRKVALSFLLCRVKNCLSFQKSSKYHTYLDRIFKSQLKLDDPKNNGDVFQVYYWLNPHDHICALYDENEAHTQYAMDIKEREKKGKTIYPVQSESMIPLRTRENNLIFRYISRIKNFSRLKEDYSSVIEKIVRKNLLYPEEITDIYGLTFVVPGEKELYGIQEEIGNFLGGTNTRKDEKKIQKAPISESLSLNSGEYFRIWKAIYDVTLPHERLEVIMRQITQNKSDLAIMNQTLNLLQKNHTPDQDIQFLHKHLKKKDQELENLQRIRLIYENRPFDLQVEIQIQDLQSYLLSKTFGSAAEHAALKRSQVLQSSLYKLFPKKVYEPFLLKLKEQFLAKYIERQ